MTMAGASTAGAPDAVTRSGVRGRAASITTGRFVHDLGGGLRVLVVAGIPVGVVVAGVGSRLAMLLLRLTSPESVRGVESDDGIALPGLFGVVIGPAVDRVGRPDSRSATGRRRLVVPIALIAVFPLVLVALLIVTPVFALWLAVRELGFVRRLRTSTGYGYLVRACWVLVVAAGLVAVVNDITAIT